jgi:GLPGLI family protein
MEPSYIEHVMRKLLFNLFGLIVVSSLTTSCNSNNEIKEGVIEFTISFPSFDMNSHPITGMLLPKRQIVSFRGNQFHAQIKKAMVEINAISNTEERYLYSELKFGSPIYFEGTISASDLNKVSIQFTDKRDTIAGFEVKQAFATSNDYGIIELWYTEEITMKDPNWHTPYYEVPGMLLAYTIFENGVAMRFTATSYSSEAIDESLFTPSKQGTSTDFKTFKNELYSVLDNFTKT